MGNALEEVEAFEDQMDQEEMTVSALHLGVPSYPLEMVLSSFLALEAYHENYPTFLVVLVHGLLSSPPLLSVLPELLDLLHVDT